MSSDRHVLLIAVGPVQPFIAAARKIRDLWSGSKMLADMAQSVADALRRDCEFVFPSPERLRSDLPKESEFGMANKILALTPADVAPDKLADEAFDAFHARLKLQFADLKAWIDRSGLTDCVDLDRLDKQAADYGEFYAVWVRIGADGYDAARSRAEQLLAARKMFRAFNPPTWTTTSANGKGLRKNSLDGARETVLTNVTSTSPLVRRHTVKLNEHLDALGLVKRWHGLHSPAAQRIEFQTLSDVALVPYFSGIEKSGSAEIVDLRARAQTAIKALPVGEGEHATLLYRNRLDVALRELEARNSEDGSEACAALSALYKEIGEPPAYACILHGDGDHMGSTLDHLTKIEHHQAFSRALAEFTNDIGEIVKRHDGSLIYSGGDDVLAFLPLHTALLCAIAIRTRFADAMKSVAEWISLDLTSAAKDPLAVFGDKPPSFSAGLAIVHHLESLQASTALARRAESIAKNDFGRDALAIIQSIRGGGELTVGGHWDSKNERTAPLDGAVDRLKYFVDLFKAEKISGRLAFQLRSVEKTLGRREGCFNFGNNTDLLANATAAEGVRLIGANDDNPTLKELEKIVGSCGDIRAIADELVVAQQIARVSNLAEGQF